MNDTETQIAHVLGAIRYLRERPKKFVDVRQVSRTGTTSRYALRARRFRPRDYEIVDFS